MGNKSFSVHVPATTANLGPGFDCLGLALDLWNTITFTCVKNQPLISIEGEGKGVLKEDESNLIIRTAKQLAASYGLSLPKNLHINCQNNIPTSSGLGSSASAVIAGLAGAREMLGLDIKDDALLQTAAQIEGHADNVSACLYGGLTLTGNEKGKFISNKLDMQPLTAIIVVPNFSLSTEAARKILPTQVPLRDSADNIYRAVKLVQILEVGKYDQLKSVMSDNLHQNYRLPHLPGAQEAMQSANDAGAYGSCLSGAGPSVIAFSNLENIKNIGDVMLQAYREIDLQARLFPLQCPAKGYYLS
jgi:homoserine kinase